MPGGSRGKDFKSGYGSKETGRGYTQDIRKNTVRRYNKVLKNENRDRVQPTFRKQKDSYARAKYEAELRKQERQEVAAKRQLERDAEEKKRTAALLASQRERKKRGRVFKSKNYKGQPAILNQMPLMLEKIRTTLKEEQKTKYEKKGPPNDVTDESVDKSETS